jgi:hypothetical protein
MSINVQSAIDYNKRRVGGWVHIGEAVDPAEFANITADYQESKGLLLDGKFGPQTAVSVANDINQHLAGRDNASNHGAMWQLYINFPRAGVLKAGHVWTAAKPNGQLPWMPPPPSYQTGGKVYSERGYSSYRTPEGEGLFTLEWFAALASLVGWGYYRKEKQLPFLPKKWTARLEELKKKNG